MNEHAGDITPNIRGTLDFVHGLELPPAPRRMRGPTKSGPAVFDKVKDQAMVVGSDIVSFVAGVPIEARQDIVNCTLLAQLAANKRVPQRDEIRAWYETYFDTLTHLGWVVQARGFSEHRETGNDFEAHQAILSVAAVVLGPATTALAVVQSTLNAMKSMSDGPWMTIFKRESQTARAARFQVTLAAPASEGASMVSLMSFDLVAKANLTQVLFVKYRSTDVTLRHASGQVTIDTDVLAAVRPAIAQKIAAYTQSYVDTLPI